MSNHHRPRTDHLADHEWGVRRTDGGVTASSRGWAEDVHQLTGLTVVRWDGRQWVDAEQHGSR